jgi:uncharacterized membrane protein YcaP (DUF421 family)
MSPPDFEQLFTLSVSPLELVVRGSAMYWFLFLLFRFVSRRDIGGIGIGDVLLLVLIADAAQNAMAGEYKSITDGCILVGTIFGWNLLVDWMAFRFPVLNRWLQPKPLPLIRNGQLQMRNLRREFITVDELRAKLREYGVERFDEVKRACIESDGEITVVRVGSAAQPRSHHDSHQRV